jgi:HK97 family phage major capsid protein
LIAASTALQTTTVLQTGNSKLRIPVMAEDPQAAFVQENHEIDPTDAVLASAHYFFSKVAALTRVSSATMDDSDPEISALKGNGTARNYQVTDSRFFVISTANGYDGVESLVAKPDAAGCEVVEATVRWKP